MYEIFTLIHSEKILLLFSRILDSSYVLSSGGYLKNAILSSKS